MIGRWGGAAARGGRSWARTGAWAAALGLALGACEPSGPGTLTATVEGPVAAGAVVVELRGAGITGVEGAGDVRVFAAPVASASDGHRVVAIGATAGRIVFRVEVGDLGASAPVGRVVAAVDANNLPIAAVDGFRVRLAR